ncbi:MAG: hypothetical protein EOP83_28350 [Verrucomicrobiaceae bacterium]|nr:MAG: hypothetical protein EOP83_28350 [Verrucomicrobiaceae bacterium]
MPNYVYVDRQKSAVRRILEVNYLHIVVTASWRHGEEMGAWCQERFGVSALDPGEGDKLYVPNFVSLMAEQSIQPIRIDVACDWAQLSYGPNTQYYFKYENAAFEFKMRWYRGEQTRSL